MRVLSNASIDIGSGGKVAVFIFGNKYRNGQQEIKDQFFFDNWPEFEEWKKEYEQE